MAKKAAAQTTLAPVTTEVMECWIDTPSGEVLDANAFIMSIVQKLQEMEGAGQKVNVYIPCRRISEDTWLNQVVVQQIRRYLGYDENDGSILPHSSPLWWAPGCKFVAANKEEGTAPHFYFWVTPKKVKKATVTFDPSALPF
jgi:hypothetical protein